MSGKAPIPGILWVNSDVIKSNELSRNAFDEWYCQKHIPDVVCKSGVTRAHRYDHMIDGLSTSRKLGFLTIYDMPDLNFMETEEFRSLEGQSPGPNQKTIFENVEFDTRAYELIQLDEADGQENSGPAPFLLCAAISHSEDSELDKWYREEHVSMISKVKGYRRTSRYQLTSRSVLSAFVRSFPQAPKWLAIHEFDGQCVPWDELMPIDETDWAKKIIPGILNADVGLFKLKHVFGDGSGTKLSVESDG